MLCAQYYRRSQRRKPSVGKPKVLSQTNTSEASVHILTTETNFLWLKQDQRIKLKKSAKNWKPVPLLLLAFLTF